MRDSFVDYLAVFPAHAGVILFTLSLLYKRHSFPRTRGGDPNSGMLNTSEPMFSPHTRG